MDNGGGMVPFTDSLNLTQNECSNYYNVPSINGISFIFEYKNQRHWVKVLFPYSYDMFQAKAKETFPDLNDKEFRFYDEKKAILTGEFLTEHIQISGRGAIITIEIDKSVIQDLDFSTTPTFSSSSNITFTDTSEEDVSGTSQQNVHKLTFSHPQLSKKGEIVTKESIKKVISESPCGKDIFEEYNTKGFLSETNRRRIINIVVTQMLILKKELKRPLTSTDKCNFAKVIVEIFPKLRDPETELGYESFYDPATKTGYLANRLSNVRRGTKRRKTCNEDSENNRNKSNVNSEDENEKLTQDEIEDTILFLKSATQNEKSLIISKHKDTFQYRRKFCLDINFFNTFPRFLDTPELIEEEYKLLFPKYEDYFLKEFIKYYEIILRVFSKIDNEIHPPLDKLEEAWDKPTRVILALCRLLPPTARGKYKATREKSNVVLEKIILFKKNDTPLQSEPKENTQPRLIAVGPNKAAVAQYFLSVDNKVILLHAQSFLKAFDILFKSHFVFNTHYDSNLVSFYRFLEKYFYKIDNNPVTPRMREVYTLLRNQLEN